MMKCTKVLAMAALGCLLACSSALAYEAGEYSPEALHRGYDKPVTVTEAPLVALEDVVANAAAYQEKKVAIHAPIMFFVTGNMYELQGESGQKLRADLGKYGGRLLYRTPFYAIGKMKADGQGNYFAVEKVIWRDVNPYKEYFAAREKARRSVDQPGDEAVVNDRDPAYFHDPIESDNKRFLQNNPKNLTKADLAAYTVVDAAAVTAGNQLEVGSKVALKGRNVATIAEDTMQFWDLNMKPVTLKMNNTYCPLGQRGTFYGTVQEENGKRFVSIDYMESIE